MRMQLAVQAYKPRLLAISCIHKAHLAVIAHPSIHPPTHPPTYLLFLDNQIAPKTGKI